MSEQLEQLAKDGAIALMAVGSYEKHVEIIYNRLLTATADLRREVEELKNQMAVMQSGKYGLTHTGQQLIEAVADNDRLRKEVERLEVEFSRLLKTEDELFEANKQVVRLEMALTNLTQAAECYMLVQNATTEKDLVEALKATAALKPAQ